MSRNWLRKLIIMVDGSPAVKYEAGSDLRVQFETISHTQQELSSLECVISNCALSTAAKFQKEGARIEIQAGYVEGSFGKIFQGEITEYQYGEKVDNFTTKLLRVWARDGDSAYNQAKISKTLAAGSTPQDIVNTSLQAMQPYGITLGQIIGVDLSKPKFPRGFPLVGMVRDTLREVATNAQATWNLNGGKLNIIGKGAQVPGGPIVLSPSTGMLGQPIVKPQGIIVSCLINPAIDVDTQIQIDQSLIVKDVITNNAVDISGADADKQNQLASLGATDGVYRVLHVHTVGDTRGPPWQMELTCVGKYTGALNSTQLGLGYS